VASRKTEIKRMMRNLDRPPLELTFLLQDVEDPVNVGSAFRIADALKVSEIVLTGISAQPPHKLITKVGRGKDQRVKWRYEPDIEVAIKGLKADGWSIAAVELSADASCYLDVEYPDRTCLLVGHEDHGVTKKALALADQRIFLPMYGKGASLNVHMALGITAFHVVHHRLLGQAPEG
jgi:23S rRNA (guanosine2251-2'-O)-methyltransferase